MPCRDYPSECFQSSNSGDLEEIRELKAQKVSMKLRLDSATRILCSVCKYIEVSNPRGVPHFEENVPGITQWWQQHQIEDAKRLEDAKASAKAKLTEEEIEVLGL